MAANYPTSVKVWSPTDVGFNYPEDLKEIVYARHVTTIYEEVTAVQQELGSGGLKTSVLDAPLSTPYDSTSGKTWNNLRERINNIERGTFDGALRKVSLVGGSTIVPSGAGVVGLNIRAAAGQTANLIEFRNSSNSIRSFVGSDGLIAGVIDGGNA
jgi:hypothetical protein